MMEIPAGPFNDQYQNMQAINDDQGIIYVDEREWIPAKRLRLIDQYEIIEISDDDEPQPSTSTGIQQSIDNGAATSPQTQRRRKTKQLKCYICTKDISLNKDRMVLKNCGHQFCVDCVTQSLQRLFSQHEMDKDVKCPLHYYQGSKCNSNLLDTEIHRALENEPKKVDLYNELVELDSRKGLITSTEPFDCDICTESIEFNKGIVLRNCLHRFCKECIQQTIMHSENVEINCPFVDGDRSCDSHLEDREIHSALSKEEYEKYLNRGLRLAQSTIKGSVLCNAVDCEGWCICEDEVNEFTCPKCAKKNCIPCKAIHPGRNCKEYQEDLASGDAEGLNSNNRRTEKCIEDIIKKGKGMKCPTCQILIMKRDGCDGMTCAMCKTHLCWATKGARWGPGGKGDTTGGCRCGVNRKKCHPKCANCH